jgi:predicted AAA+ superfamily ATPase
MIIIHAVVRSRYLPRALGPPVEAALRSHPVVVIVGGRQTGKTTLVQHIAGAERRTYQTLDDLDALELARQRPEDLLARGERLTIDEVQRVPELLLSIKRVVDAGRRPGHFLLTGSANLLLMRSVADSLSGRAIYLTLSAMTTTEKEGKGVVPAWSQLARARSVAAAERFAATLHSTRRGAWRNEALRGGLPPAAAARSARDRSLWFDGFVQTYLERDLRDLSQVSSLPDFRRLMRLAAHRLGGLLNQTDLARDAALPQPTAHRYLNLMETSFQLVRLAAWATNPTKRMVKSPRIYWRDVGVASHLIGLGRTSQIDAGVAGGLLENLVLVGLLAWRETVHPRPEIHYWRTVSGAEVDFVIELGSRLLPVEVKTATTVNAHDARHLERFIDDHPQRASWGVVLHDGDTPSRLTRRVLALPIGPWI